MPPFPAPRPRRRALTTVRTAVLTAGAVVVVTAGPLISNAATSNAVPPTPAGTAKAVEAYQPYVGQKVCDPSAKAGVLAFRDMLLKTYPTSGSLGIVRDCGSGGQSEHKEGRAFDWAVNVNNPTHVANVNALVAWLMKTDAYGNPNAMIRRTGLMYLIWNKRIWKSYESAKGWQAYSGASPHTDHVHFSFGWSGARKATSYWRPGTVAGIDYGPGGTPVPPAPVVKISAEPANIAIQRAYGDLTLTAGASQSAAAVKLVQAKVLASPVDGIFGPATAAAVRKAQTAARVAATGSWTPADWDTFFPAPTSPFGKVESFTTVPGGVRVVGTALDNDNPASIQVSFTSAAGRHSVVLADKPRADVARDFPASGANHGFDTVVPLPDGVHNLCATAVNATRSPGANAVLGCASVTASSSPQGGLDAVTHWMGATTVSGWAVDTDTADALTVDVTVNGVVHLNDVRASAPRPDAAARFPAFGAGRGFTGTLDLPDGTHTICLYAQNVGAGRSSKIGCRVHSVNRSPMGSFELLQALPAATYPASGPVVIAGWAMDRDYVNPSIVRIKVDGVVRRHVKADIARTDIASRFPGYGAGHGFSTSTALPAGRHTICVDAVNLGNRGKDVSLGCRTVQTGTPIGAFERTAVAVGKLAVVGWSLDPDNAARIDNGVFVDGRRVAVTRTGLVRNDLSPMLAPYGNARGWGITVPATKGSHRVCVTAYNLARTPGTSPSLGCKTVVVR